MLSFCSLALQKPLPILHIPSPNSQYTQKAKLSRLYQYTAGYLIHNPQGFCPLTKNYDKQSLPYPASAILRNNIKYDRRPKQCKQKPYNIVGKHIAEENLEQITIVKLILRLHMQQTAKNTVHQISQQVKDEERHNQSFRLFLDPIPKWLLHREEEA